MSVVSDLEKLVALRDSGDLSHGEFEKAKEGLLSGEVTEVSPATERNRPPFPEGGKASKSQHTFLVAILSTIAAVFMAVSAAINPSPLELLAFALFATAATLNWFAFLKYRPRELP